MATCLRSQRLFQCIFNEQRVWIGELHAPFVHLSVYLNDNLNWWNIYAQKVRAFREAMCFDFCRRRGIIHFFFQPKLRFSAPSGVAKSVFKVKKKKKKILFGAENYLACPGAGRTVKKKKEENKQGSASAYEYANELSFLCGRLFFFLSFLLSLQSRNRAAAVAHKENCFR